jgi:hypothetical protein
MATPVAPEDVYTVLRTDTDGTVQLFDPVMRQDPKSHGTVFWCRPNQPLEVGRKVQGILEFHPSEAVARGRLPGFTVNLLLPQG